MENIVIQKITLQLFKKSTFKVYVMPSLLACLLHEKEGASSVM